ncbi:hypothetical protein Pedsa_0109 [Pseudopedobacter saltans DSM 12145]|uniref:Uncharacterized protein n=1 Tax=Pseudopedobacter saltans (strain ATCC 51119 / DSM 12145 / JCM 21818 / CCUG 39354 / LMG 10337 / NBRC 100064 / NCIMB 13643) TaxID=762903 RepID=F0SCV6_PSESL|nr:hypothetical protein Pedsa_0109 [Pseudopedobacter saltans DSM 12145]
MIHNEIFLFANCYAEKSSSISIDGAKNKVAVIIFGVNSHLIHLERAILRKNNGVL